MRPEDWVRGALGVFLVAIALVALALLVGGLDAAIVAITGPSTLALAAATFFLVYQNEKTRREARHPFLNLIVTEVPTKGVSNEMEMGEGPAILLENSGPGIAYDIRVKIAKVDQTQWVALHQPSSVSVLSLFAAQTVPRLVVQPKRAQPPDGGNHHLSTEREKFLRYHLGVVVRQVESHPPDLRPVQIERIRGRPGELLFHLAELVHAVPEAPLEHHTLPTRSEHPLLTRVHESPGVFGRREHQTDTFGIRPALLLHQRTASASTSGRKVHGMFSVAAT